MARRAGGSPMPWYAKSCYAGFAMCATLTQGVHTMHFLHSENPGFSAMQELRSPVQVCGHRA
jgi:hypothetical protein